MKSLIYALIGAVVLFCVLAVIGITQPRGTSIRVWCFFYLAIAVVFDGLVVAALWYQHAILIQILLGASAGAATGLAIHVAHHIFEDGENGGASSSEK